MSGRQAKAARRTDRYREALSQVHDRLHKGDVDEAHELIHQALQHGGRITTDVAPLGTGRSAEFDSAFRDLCLNLGVTAAFVLREPSGRLVSGGNADLDAAVHEWFRAAKRAQVEMSRKLVAGLHRATFGAEPGDGDG